jgi:hypothetical protein
MGLQDSYVKKGFEKGDELEEQRKADLLEEMGLTTSDVDKLQKMMLSADEAVCAKQEELLDIRQKKSRKEEWEEFVDAKRRMGRVLHHSELIRRFRTIIPNLIVSRAAQVNRISLYVVKNTPITEIKDYPLTNNGMAFVDVPYFISFLELGESPEYEIDLVNDAQVAIGQKRGYRSLLLRLICRRATHCKACEHYDPKGFVAHPHPHLKGPATSIITERQALAAFGHPTNGMQTASNYRKQLYEFRHGLI